MMKTKILCTIMTIVCAQAMAQSDTIDFSKPDSVLLGEILVAARKTPKANSRWSDMHPVDLVTNGGANGDLYKALLILPGTQVQGESGRLVVRGGSSSEVQTFMDGMHVLQPYASTASNHPTRSRYSTFMFSGINLTTGGAPLEYGQALSAVLPLETKDRSEVNKIGVNASIVGVGFGGTRVLDGGSLSVDVNHQDLSLYNHLFPGREHFLEPYNMTSVASQFRKDLSQGTLCKVYGQYDHTRFATQHDHIFGLTEHNMYLNTTLQHKSPSACNYFLGLACSYVSRHVDGAAVEGDRWDETHAEWHIKAKVHRLLSPYLSMHAGAEAYLRHYTNRYRLDAVDAGQSLSPQMAAGFMSVAYIPDDRVKVDLSLRPELTNGNVTLSPRLAANCYMGRSMLSASLGRYTQWADEQYMRQNTDLPTQQCWQTNLGWQYNERGICGKVEVYYKHYSRLALLTERGVDSHGHGHSKGVDVYFRDRSTVRNMEYQLSYTYNIVRKKEGEYTEITTPQYATRHNAAFVAKYTLPRLNTIVSITERVSSGRPYHNPARPGLMNDELKPYSSLDVGVSYLPSPKVIVHASATNILGRNNVFGVENGQKVYASDRHFFYVGVFVTLGKKAAYDVSNF